MIFDVLDSYSSFAFYGAQTVAYGAYQAVRHLRHRIPICFVVSNMERNPKSIDGIAVTPLNALPADTLIIIAVTEIFQDEINRTLIKKGYEHSYRLTSHEEYLLMLGYYKSIGLFPPVTEGYSEEDFCLYEVRNHLDRILENPPKLQPFEIPVQAGAALTENRVCNLCDDIGENISRKNEKYCEASAMYWIWKNSGFEWVGIEHYRRHLLVRPSMLSSKVDVIMPLPYICYPNVQTQFVRFVGEDILRVLLSVLEKLRSNEFEKYSRCLYGQYFYPYNLMVARKEVFADYCSWVFEIAAYIEKLDIKKINGSRALAYIIEQLTSVYFMINAKQLNIKHAEKIIYV